MPPRALVPMGRSVPFRVRMHGAPREARPAIPRPCRPVRARRLPDSARAFRHRPVPSPPAMPRQWANHSATLLLEDRRATGLSLYVSAEAPTPVTIWRHAPVHGFLQPLYPEARRRQIPPSRGQSGIVPQHCAPQDRDKPQSIQSKPRTFFLHLPSGRPFCERGVWRAMDGGWYTRQSHIRTER